MARIREMVGDQIELKWIWDLHSAVGPGCVNRKDDVQLVQHAINTLSAHFDLMRPDGKPVGYLKRDGIFGPATKIAVMAYQRAKKTRGTLITPDGMISPSSKDGWTKSGNAQYTIVYLNRDHVKVQGKMMDEKDFPNPLAMTAAKEKPVRG